MRRAAGHIRTREAGHIRTRAQRGAAAEHTVIRTLLRVRDLSCQESTVDS